MLPRLRFIVACWNRTPGTHPFEFRLGDIKTMLYPQAGHGYPVEVSEITLFALMTGCRGVYEFVVRLRHGVGPTERVAWEGPPGRIDLGTDPVTVRVLTFQLKGVPFDHPGQYEFVLVCNGAELSPTHYLEASA